MNRNVGISLAVVLVFTIFCSASFAQYREYHVTGKVVDKDQKPVSGVEIKIRDQESSHSFTTHTDKDGAFEFIGLPHGVYTANLKKEGYITKTDEWKFEQSQDRMQKVSVPAVILVTEGQLSEMTVTKELQAGVEQATEKVRNGDFDGAQVLLKPLLDKRPDDPNLLYLNGVCLRNKQSFDAAAEAFQKVIAANPSFAPAHLQLGMCYQQKKMLDQAVESYKKALELDPTSVAAAYNAGMALYTENKPADALSFLEKASALKADDADILEAIAYCHLQLGNTAKSLEYLQRAITLVQDPEKRKAIEEEIQKLKEAGNS